MKKHFGIKPFVIAAAIMTTGAVSVIGASAATSGNVSDLIAPATVTEQPAAPAAPASPTAPEEPAHSDIPALTYDESGFISSATVDPNGKYELMIPIELVSAELIREDSDGTKYYKTYNGYVCVHVLTTDDEYTTLRYYAAYPQDSE